MRKRYVNAGVSSIAAAIAFGAHFGPTVRATLVETSTDTGIAARILSTRDTSYEGLWGFGLNNEGQVGVVGGSSGWASAGLYNQDLFSFLDRVLTATRSGTQLLYSSSSGYDVNVSHSFGQVLYPLHLRMDEQGQVSFLQQTYDGFSTGSTNSDEDSRIVLVNSSGQTYVPSSRYFPAHSTTTFVSTVSMSSQGNIAFSYLDENGDYELYTASSPQIVTDDYDVLHPWVAYSAGPVFGGPQINDSGEIAFGAYDTGYDPALRVAISDGMGGYNLTTIADGNNGYDYTIIAPSRVGQSTTLNNNSEVVFYGPGGLYLGRYGSGVSVVLLAGSGAQTDNGHDADSSYYISTDINEAGEVLTGDNDVVWVASESGGVVTRKEIAYNTTDTLFPLEINDASVVSYQLQHSGVNFVRQLYLSDGISTVLAVAENISSSVDGNNLQYAGLNDFGQLSYTIMENLDLNDDMYSDPGEQEQDIYIFTPDLHWRTTSSGAWKSYDKWTLGLAPGYGPDPTLADISGHTAPDYRAIIDPDNGNVIVTMPSENVSVKSLQIGGTESFAVNLQLAAGKTLTAIDGVDVESNGSLWGSYGGGTSTIVGDLTNDGEVYPGGNLSIGSLVVSSGDFTQSSTGKLTFEIADNTGFPDLDELSVDGTVDLDGTLEIILAGYTPTMYETFDIIFAGTLGSGEFNTVIGSVIGNAYVPEFDVIYNTGADKVSVQYLGTQSLLSPPPGDTVPEPASLMLLAAGLGLLCRRRRG